MRISASVFEIDPRRYRGDRFYLGFLVVFWLIWAPATLFVTGLLLTEGGPKVFLAFWLLFGWAGTLMIPVTLFTRKRKQRLAVEADRLLVYGTQPFSRRPQEIRREHLEAFTLERYDEESVVTLNLFLSRWPKRIMLGAMVHPDGKVSLFPQIAAFLREHGFVFEKREELV